MQALNVPAVLELVLEQLQAQELVQPVAVEPQHAVPVLLIPAVRQELLERFVVVSEF